MENIYSLLKLFTYLEHCYFLDIKMSNSKNRIKQEQMHDSYIKQVSSKSVIKTIVMGRAESGPKESNQIFELKN